MSDEGYQPFPDISAWTAVPFDPTTYEQYAALLEQARAEATEEAREHAVRTAIRYAGTDTGAIEGLYTTDRGFTRTVAIEAAHWEAAANERGPNAAEIIKDQIAAYEWVLDLVTEKRPVTEHMIRELHAMLCRSQDTYVVHTAVGRQERPLPKGEYKDHPNNPTSATTGQLHHYAPPDIVGPEMGRLVASLSSDQFVKAHPVVQAAYLHYSLAAIHPFADGNGRTSRALASVPLYRALHVPLVVLADQRDDYLDALAAADVGDLTPFTSFIADRVFDTAELVHLTAAAAEKGDMRRSVQSLRAVFLKSGFSDEELDAHASRVLDLIEQTVRDELASAELPGRVTCEVRRVPTTGSSFRAAEPNKNYRRAHPDDLLEIEVTVDGGEGVGLANSVRVEVAKVNGVAPLLVPGDPPLTLSVRDLRGGLGSFAKIKIDTWARMTAATTLATVAHHLPRMGYGGSA